MKPSPRDVLARAFLLSMEYNLGKEVEEVSENLAEVALKALKEAGFGIWHQMDADDEAKEDQW